MAVYYMPLRRLCGLYGGPLYASRWLWRLYLGWILCLWERYASCFTAIFCKSQKAVLWLCMGICLLMAAWAIQWPYSMCLPENCEGYIVIVCCWKFCGLCIGRKICPWEGCEGRIVVVVCEQTISRMVFCSEGCIMAIYWYTHGDEGEIMHASNMPHHNAQARGPKKFCQNIWICHVFELCMCTASVAHTQCSRHVSYWNKSEPMWTNQKCWRYASLWNNSIMHRQPFCVHQQTEYVIK